jgi:hypothetical protein
VIQLAFRVHVSPDSSAHDVRLYRNSREDVLATIPAVPGVTVEHKVIVDALPGDRFLVALAPGDTPGGTAALHVFVSDTTLPFPSTCRFAALFSEIAANNPKAVDNLCGGEVLYFDSSGPNSPPLGTQPVFPELGSTGYFEGDLYYHGNDLLTRDKEITVQLWALNTRLSDTRSWLFSDADEDVGGGLALELTNLSTKLEVSTVIKTSPATYASASFNYGAPTAWHFVRVIHASDTVTVCLDGARVGSAGLPGPIGSTIYPYLGRNATWETSFGLTGTIDDVRVFHSALPCD